MRSGNNVLKGCRYSRLPRFAMLSIPQLSLLTALSPTPASLYLLAHEFRCKVQDIRNRIVAIRAAGFYVRVENCAAWISSPDFPPAYAVAERFYDEFLSGQKEHPSC